MNKYEIKVYKEYCTFDCVTTELVHKYMTDHIKVVIYLPIQNKTVTIKRSSYPEIFVYSDNTITVYLDGDKINTSKYWFRTEEERRKFIAAIPSVEEALKRFKDIVECEVFTIEF